MHVFYAQGGGLGHLTRINTVVNTYKIPQNEVIIMSPSVFSKYFEYQFIKLSWNASTNQWTEPLLNYIKNNKITALYIDAFPFGLKGELIPVYKQYPQLSYIYISRILKWEFYLKTVSPTMQPVFSKTLILEKLYDTHLNWIKQQSKQLEKRELTTYPDQKSVKFIKSPYIIIAHSGGKSDVQKLCKLVIDNENLDVDVSVIVFTQVDLKINHPKFKVYTNLYPISQYFKHAEKIYTGCGFNSIQELKQHRNKHIVIPFEKLFDDQFFRSQTLNSKV